MAATAGNARPVPDQVLVAIADYVHDHEITSEAAYRTARFCVIDALGCAIEALRYPECTKLLGPLAPGMHFEHGARVPGTRLELDPVNAAFSLGTMIRWLDFNDAFTAAEGGHPSDNLGGILATADYVSRRRTAGGKPALTMRDVLTAAIKAYEIQGVLSLENNLTQFGFDHTALLRVASTAVCTRILGGDREDIVNAVSNAFADGMPVKIYRQGDNIGSRKNWAAGEATSRGVRLALIALTGETGYPSVLTAKSFGVYDALFKGQPFAFRQAYGSYVMENVMYKFVAAGMHGQTAAECAFKLHPEVGQRLEDVDSITIHSHAKLLGIMDKPGPLANASARDHSVQYVVAVGLIHGNLEGAHFDDEFAADPRIDRLRAKMTVVEEPRYTREFHDPAKRSSANRIEVRFRDGSAPLTVEVEYPMGHPRRRVEGLPMVESKFRAHLARHFAPRQQVAILEMCIDQARFEAAPVYEFMERFVA